MLRGCRTSNPWNTKGKPLFPIGQDLKCDATDLKEKCKVTTIRESTDLFWCVVCLPTVVGRGCLVREPVEPSIRGMRPRLVYFSRIKGPFPQSLTLLGGRLGLSSGTTGLAL